MVFYKKLISRIKLIFLVINNSIMYPVLSSEVLAVIINNRYLKSDFLRHYTKLSKYSYSNNFCYIDRCRFFLSHYDFLYKKFDKCRFFDNRELLWSMEVDNHFIDVFCSPPIIQSSREGELLLTFYFDEKPIFNLGFLFSNAYLFSDDDGEVIFITRIQGVNHNYELIKAACRLMHNLNLSNVSLSVIQGMCQALDIKTIIGINSINQLSFNDSSQSRFLSIYDELWLKNGATIHNNEYYRLAMPLVLKEFSEISNSHRSRALKHRRLRDEISSSVASMVNSMVYN